MVEERNLIDPVSTRIGEEEETILLHYVFVCHVTNANIDIYIYFQLFLLSLCHDDDTHIVHVGARHA
jgi:hypothetical protein